MNSPLHGQKPQLRLVRGAEETTAPATPPATPAFDDTELLSAVRAGDRAAATALYDRVRPQVDRTLRRLLGAHDADYQDLAQLALIELVMTIDRFRGECSLDAWVSTLTARVVYKKLRRRQLERKFFSSLGSDDVMAATSSASSKNTVTRDTLTRVRTHLDQLEEGRAWAFLLHDVCGYDLREMSEIMGVSVAAAQSRLVRGRRDLHSRIAADPDLAKAMSELEVEP